MHLTREYALSAAVEAARREAVRLEADEADAQDLEYEARDLINALFGSVGDRSSSTAYAEVNEWRHRDALVDLHADWRYLGIERAGLIAASERYLGIPWMRDERLDWLVADLLMYAEIVATFDFVRLSSRSILLYSAQRARPGFALVLAWAWEAVKWSVWLWVSRTVYSAGPLALGAWFIATIAFWYNKRKLPRKTASILGEMNRCYLVTASGSFSWDVLWEELRRTRELGAVWDGVLYKLVEARRRHAG